MEKKFNPETNLDVAKLLMDYMYKEHGNKYPKELLRGNDDHNELDFDKGILIIGTVGTGKSLILQAMGKVRNVPNPILGRFITEGEIIHSVLMKTGHYDNHVKYERIVDDFGVAQRDFKREIMQEFIQERYNLFRRGIKTHMTTNLSLGEIEKTHSIRVKDRIIEMFNIIKMTGESLRK